MPIFYFYPIVFWYKLPFNADMVSCFIFKAPVKQRILIEDSELEVYFSPKDKAISNAVLPLIKNAKK